MNLSELLEKKKVIICAGTGGVGKTTLSSAIATLAAMKGKKVLVLTVDPAKRLASALGLDSLEHKEIRVNADIAGELFATIVDPKEVFDSFVLANSTREDSKKILDNRIYHKLSTSLSGSQEFTALERFYRAYESGTYDLIVVDTPPASHALDFLDSAARLSALFHEQIVKWFVRPLESENIFTNLFYRGTSVAFKALERLTGGDFVRELVEFFVVIYSLRTHLVHRLDQIQSVLKSPESAFVLVTAYDQTKLKMSSELHLTLHKRGYSLSHVIVNRCFPAMDVEEAKSMARSPDLKKLIELYERLSAYYDGHKRSIDAFKENLKGEVGISLIPDQDQDIFDIGGLMKIARLLNGGENK